MRRLMFVLALSLMIVAVGFAGCLDGGDEETYTGQFKDQMGNVVDIPEPPDRIISLAPSLTEILFKLHLDGKLVGCDEASASISGAGDLSVVSTWMGLDLEGAVALEPDIVFMDKTLDMSGDIHTAMTEVEITVFVFFPKSMDDMLEQITMIGDICDEGDAGEDLRADLEDRIEDVEAVGSAYTASQKPKVLYVTYYDGLDNPWVGTVSTISADLIKMAGGKNVVSDNTGYVVQVSLETIIAEDPDIIITSQSSTWPTTSREVIMEDDTLKDVSAVKNGKVFDIDGNLIDRPGPRMVDGLEEIHGHIADYVAA